MDRIGCKHLDYEEGKYTDCTIDITTDGVRFWRRGPRWTNDGNNPVFVQFCKLRGRINSIYDCYESGPMGCYEAPDE